MDSQVLICNKLCKSYKTGQPVLNEFSFCVESGRVVGLLGPNGCGKSTLLKLVSGILVPDGGEIIICGKERSEESNSLLSFLPERPYFASNMKIGELLEFFSDFYGDFDVLKAKAMLADFSISLDSRIRSLSKGNKEKVQLILVMSRRARLYLLDEPIGGVDPAARDYVLDAIIKNRNEESSVLITTHLISDVERILDDYAFMSYGGQIIASGNAEEARCLEGRSLDEQFREVFKCSKNA